MAYRKLGRDSSARKALLRSIVTSLFQHERIETTEAKAKELRKVADKTVSYTHLLAGVRNILTKSIGSSNPNNMVQATLEGLSSLKDVNKVAELRGKTVEEIYG